MHQEKSLVILPVVIQIVQSKCQDLAIDTTQIMEYNALRQDIIKSAQNVQYFCLWFRKPSNDTRLFQCKSKASFFS